MNLIKGLKFGEGGVSLIMPALPVSDIATVKTFSGESINLSIFFQHKPMN